MDVRCATPGCDKKLADHLVGTVTLRCPRCKQTNTYVFTPTITPNASATQTTVIRTTNLPIRVK